MMSYWEGIKIQINPLCFLLSLRDRRPPPLCLRTSKTTKHHRQSIDHLRLQPRSPDQTDKDDNNQIPRWAAINRTPHLVNRINQMQTVYALLLLHATWSTTIITVTSSISVRSVLLTTPSFDTRSTAKRSDRIHRQFELDDTACTSEAANRVLFLTR